MSTSAVSSWKGVLTPLGEISPSQVGIKAQPSLCPSPGPPLLHEPPLIYPQGAAARCNYSTTYDVQHLCTSLAEVQLLPEQFGVPVMGGLTETPSEVLELICDFASRTRYRRKSALNLSLVSKRFHLPALRALYRELAVNDTRQYDGLLAATSRLPQQPPLLSARRMYLVIRDPAHPIIDLTEEEEVVEGISVQQAVTLLDGSAHLRSLHLESTVSLDRVFAEWKPLRFLTRLHVESTEPIAAQGLFAALSTMPLLQKLFVSKLESAKDAEMPDLPSFPMRSVTLAESSISDRDLLALSKSCSETLRDLVLLSCKTITKRGMVDVLRLIGPGLNSCELRACTFADDTPAGQPSIGPFLDDIAAYCPFLLELQVCSDEICTPAILSRALLRLPLRHVELNCRLPHFEPMALVEALRNVPIGRLETLFIGPHLKWNEDALGRVKRACDQQAITFSSGLDLDQLGDPPSPPADEETQ